MITLKIDYPHQCPSPTIYVGTDSCAPGSLWECNECGREWMKTGYGLKRDVWQPTVQIVEPKRGRKSVQN